MNRGSNNIAVISWGVKLGEERKGYTRFLSIAETLRRAGYNVDLVTSVFQHWDKAKPDVEAFPYGMHDFEIVFVNEPGYTRNVDPLRMASHRRAAKNLSRYLADHGDKYDLVYCEIPPNDVALAAARFAESRGIPFVADVNDLWPEAMKMVLDVPALNPVLYSGFDHDKRETFRRLSAVVGTSDEYARHPFEVGTCPEGIESLTVYVGNDIAAFDAGAAEHGPAIDKPEGEFWVAYAGTLGASYDVATLIDASAELVNRGLGQVKVLILGDGPDGEALRERAAGLECNVEFAGYLPYDEMCAYLAKSDVTVNSLVAKAPQSIVTKIGDYLAAGKPMINTGSSPEFRGKVEADGFGLNVPAEDVRALADAIERLFDDPELCAEMGRRARAIAEEQFDRARSYRQITALVDRLLSR